MNNITEAVLFIYRLEYQGIYNTINIVNKVIRYSQDFILKIIAIINRDIKVFLRF